jgi:excisionase family DNA binding protein
MPDRLLTVQDVADRLRVPLSWVYERTRSNDIPGLVKIGKYVRIRESELESYIEHGGSLKKEKVEKTFTPSRLHIGKFEKLLGRDLTTSEIAAVKILQYEHKIVRSKDDTKWLKAMEVLNMLTDIETVKRMRGYEIPE